MEEAPSDQSSEPVTTHPLILKVCTFPDINLEAAFEYEVEMHKKKHQWGSIKCTHSTADKTSLKFTQLKTDTKYVFRVNAVNEIYQAGEWSEEVEAQTQFGVLGCALGTTGALVGGTVGGPLIGAFAGGMLCGIAAGDIPNSDREKTVTAAGIAGGISGAIGGAIMGT